MTRETRLTNHVVKVLGLGLLLSTTLMPSAWGDCPVDEAISNLKYGAIQLNAGYAREMLPIVDELNKLLPGNNNALPVGLQMSPQAARRFEKLSFDLLLVRSKKLILSAYVRDARVIAKMAQIARNVSKGKSYTDTDPDSFYYRTLLLTYIANETPDGPPPIPSKDECSIDSGLWMNVKLELDPIDPDKMNAARERLMAVAKQFNIDTTQQGWLDQIERIPSLAAKKGVRFDAAIVADGSRRLQFIKAIESLRALNQVSIMIYGTHLADINAATSKTDFHSRFGSTWEAQLKVSDDRIKRLEGIIRVFEQKVPSDAAIENQQLSDTVKKVN